jgi:transcriptional regulator with XRE-family HTH domain
MTTLIKFRRHHGLTQKQTAALLGVSERTLIRYEQALPYALHVILPLALEALSGKLGEHLSPPNE